MINPILYTYWVEKIQTSSQKQWIIRLQRMLVVIYLIGITMIILLIAPGKLVLSFQKEQDNNGVESNNVESNDNMISDVQLCDHIKTLDYYMISDFLLELYDSEKIEKNQELMFMVQKINIKIQQDMINKIISIKIFSETTLLNKQSRIHWKTLEQSKDH